MSESQKKQAWITSLRLLTATPKSRKDLAKKLSEKGYDNEVIRQTLEELEAKGILNDRAYAENLVSRHLYGRPSGVRKISFELKRRGISSKLQEELLTPLSGEQETQRAWDAATQRWERFKRIPIENRKRRVYDFLLRRGFEFQLVRDIIETLEKESP